MSKKDAETKQFFQDTEHFADAFNYFLFNGENKINPKTQNLKSKKERSMSICVKQNANG